ncbi:MAG: AMP-binding protein [candidate division KSB1 bacterium]|nr:AMP-binding protein [candidate division KSB1 bacterium]MDZ7302437.1 AMP-binding protein [candidate division KSB1 bacterium]MDZ7311639.1 AMP-binding protein [candidate division KSB1 bacterium]
MFANTLFDFLARCSLDYATHECIVYGETRLTYGYFSKVVDRLAVALAELGLKPGQRMALMLPNVPQFPIIYYTLLKLGVWVVPINVLFKENEIRHVMEDSGADGFVAWEGFSRHLLSAVAEAKQCRLQIFFGEKIPPGSIDLTQLIAASMQRFERLGTESKINADADDPAVILYTAGATGMSKGAVFSHRNLAAAISACWKNFAIGCEDRFLAVMPLFHHFGQMMAMNLPMAAGATTVLLPRFDPQAIIETIAKERITHFVAVPSMFPALLHLAPDPAQLATLKCCIVSGTMMPARIREAFEDRYHVPIYEGYGLTECSPLVTTFSPSVPRSTSNACSVGLPLPGLEVAVLDPNRRHVPDGTVGEIFVRGPWTMQGYLNHGQISRETYWHDWLDTADLGLLDSEGFLHLVNRRNDVILKGGFAVYPSEVEAFLSLHPKIEECAVIGVPDRVHGEEVKAYIVVRPNQSITRDEIVGYCKASLPVYKCPRHIEFCESLPRSATGKVLKHLLREKKAVPATITAPAPLQAAAETPATQSEVSTEDQIPTTSETTNNLPQTETTIVEPQPNVVNGNLQDNLQDLKE